MIPGEQCKQEGCSGRMVVYTTRINFALELRVRYLHCSKCGDMPEGNKFIVPLKFAPAKGCTKPSTTLLP